MDFKKAKKIMGKNFIGPEELKKISSRLNIIDPAKIKKIPDIPFKSSDLNKMKRDCILILGMPKNKKGEKLTINNMRAFFGWDPRKKEPCFYNQDWYLKEKFANNKTLDLKWYLIKKNVNKNSRGKNPDQINKLLKSNEDFPSAILCAFTFFAYYFKNRGEMLWKHNFIWCSDKDKNGDRIYVGRYIDQKKINKDGFNVHRHLSIKPCYGLAPRII